MNLYKRYLSLFPTVTRYYGELISIAGDRLSIQLLGGGVLTVTSSDYVTQFSVQDKVWVTFERQNVRLDSAPDLPAVAIDV